MSKKTNEQKPKKKVAVKKESFGIYEALFAFQGEELIIPKKGKGNINGREYSYAMLDDLITVTRPMLQKYGIVLTQPAEDGNLVTRLYHVVSKQEIVSKLPLGNPGSSQELGARITYLRRYMLNAALGLPNEDVDGAGKDGPLVTMPVLPKNDIRENSTPVVENQMPKSEHFVKVEKAIQSCTNPAVLETFVTRVNASTNLNDEEKKELVEMIHKKETEIDGTIR